MNLDPYLVGRGINPTSIIPFGLIANGQRFTYPITDENGLEIARRSKAFDHTAKIKVFWVSGQQHTQTAFYNMPALASNHAGQIWLANGEPSVWAMASGGFENVICHTSGENNPPKNFGDLLTSKGVSRILMCPDNDDTGRKSAAKIMRLCLDAHLDFQAFDLQTAWVKLLAINPQAPQEAPQGADLADLLYYFGRGENGLIQPASAAKVLAVLQSCPMTIEAEQPKEARADYVMTSTGEFNPQVVQTVESALYAMGGKVRRGNQLDILSPAPHSHDRPGEHAVYYLDNKTAYDFARGEWFGLKDLADWLRIDLQALGGLYEQISQRAPQTKRHNDKPVHLPKLGDFADLIEVNTRYLNQADFDLQARLVGVKSAMGTGKTEWIIDQLKPQIDQGKRVIFPVPNRSLANQLTKRLCKSGIQAKHYHKDFSGDALANNPPQVLVICLPSLQKLLKNNELPIYEVMVLDEIEQSLNFLADTGQQRIFKGAEGQLAHTLLIRFIQSAEKVFFMDAHLSDFSINWLYRHTSERAQVVVNTYRKPQKDMDITSTDEGAVIDQLEDYALAGGRAVFLSDHKEQPAIVAASLQEKGIKAICLNASTASYASNAHLLTDLDHALEEYQVICFSPVLQSGVDCQTPVKVFFAYHHDGLPVLAQLQQLGRFRQAIDLIGYSRKMEKQAPTDLLEIAHQFAKRAHLQTSFGFHYEFDEKGLLIHKPADQNHFDLYCTALARENQLMNHPFEQFCALAGEDYSITLLDDLQEDEIAKALRDEIGAERADEHKALVLTSEPIDDETYKSHQKSDTSSPLIEAGHERYEIEFFHKRTITERLYDRWNKGQRKSQLNLFILYQAGNRAAIGADQRQLEELVPIQHRAHYTSKTQAIIQTLARVFPNGLQGDTLTERELEDCLPAFNEAYEANQADLAFNRRAHESKVPKKRLRYILGTMGISLRRKRKTLEGVKTWVYWLDHNHLAENAYDARRRLEIIGGGKYETLIRRFNHLEALGDLGGLEGEPAKNSSLYTNSLNKNLYKSEFLPAKGLAEPPTKPTILRNETVHEEGVTDIPHAARVQDSLYPAEPPTPNGLEISHFTNFCYPQGYDPSDPKQASILSHWRAMCRRSGKLLETEPPMNEILEWYDRRNGKNG